MSFSVYMALRPDGSRWPVISTQGHLPCERPITQRARSSPLPSRMRRTAAAISSRARINAALRAGVERRYVNAADARPQRRALRVELVREELDSYGKVIRGAGIKPQ